GLVPYKPLIVMIFVVVSGAGALAIHTGLSFMQLFMGLFLLNFAMFKLFDTKGFAESFAMYDVIGKRSRLYAQAYPFIELFLAWGYLLHVAPVFVNGLTAIVMIVGLIGIIRNIMFGNATRCACMGSLINVPVGSVTILENVSMAAMAVLMLVHLYLV